MTLAAQDAVLGDRTTSVRRALGPGERSDGGGVVALAEQPPARDGVAADGGSGGLVRLALHLTLAGLPLLAISAHVFGLLAMHLSAGLVVLPLALAVGLLVMFDPIAEERVVLRGALWGAFATAVYDAFRLDTVYLLGWWGDFIPTMGTWLLDADADALVAGAIAGYLWRYLGDGAGIGAMFFVLVAATGLRRLGRRGLIAAAAVFAVFPVWTGLVATVGIAPGGQAQMFPLNATTVTLSLIGHVIFGVVLGLGCARCPDLERDWPWPPLLDREPAALRRRLLPGRDGTRAVNTPPRPRRSDRWGDGAPRDDVARGTGRPLHAPRSPAPPARYGPGARPPSYNVPAPGPTEITGPVPPPIAARRSSGFPANGMPIPARRPSCGARPPSLLTPVGRRHPRVATASGDRPSGVVTVAARLVGLGVDQRRDGCGTERR